MNKYAAMAVHNGLLIILTGLALHLTGSLWSVLILFFCVKVSKGDD